MHDPIENSTQPSAMFDASGMDLSQVANIATLFLPVIEKRVAATETPLDDLLYVAAKVLLNSSEFIAAAQKVVDATKK